MVRPSRGGDHAGRHRAEAHCRRASRRKACCPTLVTHRKVWRVRLRGHEEQYEEGPMTLRFSRALCAPLAALMFVVSGPLPSAQAAMVPTDQVVRAAPQVDASVDRERL